MMTKKIPDREAIVRTGNFKIPIIYTNDIVQLVTKLLKYDYKERPDLIELFSSQYIISYIERLSRPINYDIQNEVEWYISKEKQ